uniref:Uncharacterized protein n=1 Tax=Ectopseudomonas mendocina TaxID=300 RepID=Q8RKT4_ECTME|nr:unknown [Pseudomonas mendocina]
MGVTGGDHQFAAEVEAGEVAGNHLLERQRCFLLPAGEVGQARVDAALLERQHRVEGAVGFAEGSEHLAHLHQVFGELEVAVGAKLLQAVHALAGIVDARVDELVGGVQFVLGTEQLGVLGEHALAHTLQRFAPGTFALRIGEALVDAGLAGLLVLQQQVGHAAVGRDDEDTLVQRCAFPAADEDIVENFLEAAHRRAADLVAPGELLPQSGMKGISRSRPVVSDVALVLVSRQGGPRYQRLEQLSGRSLALPPGSAAGPALAQLNKQLMERKLAPIVAEWVDPTLAVEDVLEMVQAGVYPATVVEQTIAQRWAKVMPKLRIEQHLSLGEKTSMHWFVRKEASMLRASADRFLKDYDLPDNQDAAFERVYRRLYKVQYPLGLAASAWKRSARPCSATPSRSSWTG